MTIAAALAHQHPEIEVLAPSPATCAYSRDAGTRRLPSGGPDESGPTVALPATVHQVQQVVALAARLGVEIVPRGAGSGLSGGATATARQLVVSTERLTRIIEVLPTDELAVVEAGVINAHLNTLLEPYGLFYAPDPASHDISTIGGNIATNAGGLRCAKYGVTRESVLALDVVLADGSLVSAGHRSIKGVTGLDLVSLFTGSEGAIGIVVSATLKLHPIPVARRTLSVFFDSTDAGARSIAAIVATRVRPAIVELFDTPTLADIDDNAGSRLREQGASLLLVELDGFGIDEQERELTAALTAAGGRVRAESDAEAERLWELRRKGRGFGKGRLRWIVGEDIAVPRSVLPEVFAYFPEIERRYGVAVSAVAHALDGNLHPVIAKDVPPGVDPAIVPDAVHQAATDLVRFAVARGGTVSGEHGIGSIKLGWAPLELSERSIRLQRSILDALDPLDRLNPGKVVPRTVEPAPVALVH